MANIELHFFAPNDLNGSTVHEMSDDDAYFERFEMEMAQNDLGYGKVVLSRQVGFAGFGSGTFDSEAFVRVLVPVMHPTQYVWGFHLSARTQRVISRRERGGEEFTFGGPGPKFYLARAALFPEQFTATGWNLDIDDWVFRWSESATAGRVLNRILAEVAANTTVDCLPDLTRSFDGTNDSGGNPWTNELTVGPGEFELPIGQSILEDLWEIEDQGDIETRVYLGEVGAPLMRLDARPAMGRNLTAASVDDFSSGVVHFKERVNILSDLDSEGTSYRRSSHVIVRGKDRSRVVVEKPSWSPGNYAKVSQVEHRRTNNEDALEKYGLTWLRHQDAGEDEIELEIIPGHTPTAGKYFPSPPSGDGHFWYGDMVSLTSGADPGSGTSWTPLDYRNEAQRVMRIKMELEPAALDTTTTTKVLSWKVNPILNVERGSRTQGGNSAEDTGVDIGCHCLKLCVAAEPVEIVACDGTTTGLKNTGEVGGYEGWHACDLDTGTSWSSTSFPVSAQWWARDLGAATPIGTVRINQTGDLAGNLATDVEIWATDDTAKWAALAYPHNFSTTGWTNVGTLTGLTASDTGNVAIAGGTYRYWAFDASAGGGNGWAVAEFGLGSSEEAEAASEELVGVSPRAARCDHKHQADDVIGDIGSDATDAHLADTTDAHDASAISFTPNGSIAATNVQTAIQEVRDEASAGVSDHGALTGLGDDDHPQYMANPTIALGDLIVASGTTYQNEATTGQGASASASTTYSTYVAGRAIDENDATEWGAVNEPAGEWLRVNLGSAKDIKAFRALQSSNSNNRADVYKLQSSTDDSTWTDRYTVSGAVVDSGDIALGTAISARYWRLLAVSDSVSGGWVINTFALYTGVGVTVDRLPIGTPGQILAVNAGGDGVEWIDP